MKAQLLFQKGLHLLDRGQVSEGELALRQAMSQFAAERDAIGLARVQCCLGELLAELGRVGDAIELLEEVLRGDVDDDQLDYERQRAREVLAGLQ